MKYLADKLASSFDAVFRILTKSADMPVKLE